MQDTFNDKLNVPHDDISLIKEAAQRHIARALMINIAYQTRLPDHNDECQCAECVSGNRIEHMNNIIVARIYAMLKMREAMHEVKMTSLPDIHPSAFYSTPDLTSVPR